MERPEVVKQVLALTNYQNALTFCYANAFFKVLHCLKSYAIITTSIVERMLA